MKKILIILLLITINLFGQFAGGAGTSVNPYQISTVTHLNNVRTYPSSYFILMNNIDGGNSEFIGIGTTTSPFIGNFNGNGFTIKNLIIAPYVQSTYNSYYGLFAITNGGSIYNLVLDNIKVYPITGYDIYNPQKSHYYWLYNGQLIGKNTGTNVSNILIKNGYSLLSNNVGGITGFNQSTSYYGLLIGQNNNATITNCAVRDSKLEYDDFTSSGASIQTYTGGLIGAHISGTVSKVSIIATLTISYFSNSNSTMAIYKQYFGGAIGYNSGNINNSYSITYINRLYPTGTAGKYKCYWGGFAGLNNNGGIVKCYSRPKILNSGGLFNVSETIAGYFDSNLSVGSISSCISTDDYYNRFTTKGNYSSGVINSDTTVMKENSIWNSNGYDLINIWGIDATKNYGYPYLLNHYTETTMSVPSAPILLSPANNQNNVDISSTILSWYSVTGATNYYYEVLDNSDILVTSGYSSSTTKELNGILNYNTIYKWKVAAVNPAGQTFSSYWQFTTEQFTGTLVAPVLIYPSADTTGVELPYLFRWHPSSGATKYDFELWNTSTSELIDSTNDIIDTTNIPSGTLYPGVKYRWKVRSKDNSSNTSLWVERFFNTTNAIPIIPTLIYPDNNDTNAIINNSNFTWNKILNADKYYIQALDSLTQDTLYAAWINEPDTIASITTIKGFNTYNWYRWRLKANNNLGDGNYSNWNKFKTGDEYGGSGVNPNLPSLIIPNCLGGYGAAVTEPKRDTLAWESLKMTGGTSNFVKGIGFIRSSEDNSRDTLFITNSTTSSPKDMYKFPNWMGNFILYSSNSTWLTNNPQWWKDGGNWIHQRFNNLNTLNDQMSTEYGGSTLQIDSVNFLMSVIYYPYPSFTAKPALMWVNNGTATRYVSSYTGGVYNDNFSKPFKINDSLFVAQIAWTQVQGSGYYRNIYDYIYILNKNNSSWRRFLTIFSDSIAAVAYPPVITDKIGGVFQVDTSLYFYTNRFLASSTNNILNRMKIWKLTPTGVIKLFSSADGTALDTITDYNCIWDSKINFTGTADTALSIMVDHWMNPADCYWYFQAYNKIEDRSDIFKFDGITVTKINHPNTNADLSLSSAYMTPDGTDLFMIYQDWDITGGGAASLGYRIHLLTNVIDTFNVPYGTANNDSTGLFNYCQYYNGKLYLTQMRHTSGFTGTSIMGDAYMNKIAVTDYDKAIRNYPPVRNNEIKIRGIKPKGLRKTRLK
jgi:hypothetical protein